MMGSSAHTLQDGAATGAFLTSSMEECQRSSTGDLAPPGQGQGGQGDAGGTCRAVWDGWLCWPRTQAGATTQRPCPPIFQFNINQLAYRRCLANGTWFGAAAASGGQQDVGWSNYTLCVLPSPTAGAIFPPRGGGSGVTTVGYDADGMGAEGPRATGNGEALQSTSGGWMTSAATTDDVIGCVVHGGAAVFLLLALVLWLTLRLHDRLVTRRYVVLIATIVVSFLFHTIALTSRLRAVATATGPSSSARRPPLLLPPSSSPPTTVPPPPSSGRGADNSWGAGQGFDPGGDQFEFYDPYASPPLEIRRAPPVDLNPGGVLSPFDRHHSSVSNPQEKRHTDLNPAGVLSPLDRHTPSVSHPQMMRLTDLNPGEIRSPFDPHHSSGPRWQETAGVGSARSPTEMTGLDGRGHQHLGTEKRLPNTIQAKTKRNSRKETVANERTRTRYRARKKYRLQTMKVKRNEQIKTQNRFREERLPLTKRNSRRGRAPDEHTKIQFRDRRSAEENNLETKVKPRRNGRNENGQSEKTKDRTRKRNGGKKNRSKKKKGGNKGGNKGNGGDGKGDKKGDKKGIHDRNDKRSQNEDSKGDNNNQRNQQGSSENEARSETREGGDNRQGSSSDDSLKQFTEKRNRDAADYKDKDDGSWVTLCQVGRAFYLLCDMAVCSFLLSASLYYTLVVLSRPLTFQRLVLLVLSGLGLPLLFVTATILLHTWLPSGSAAADKGGEGGSSQVPAFGASCALHSLGLGQGAVELHWAVTGPKLLCVVLALCLMTVSTYGFWRLHVPPLLHASAETLYARQGVFKTLALLLGVSAAELLFLSAEYHKAAYGWPVGASPALVHASTAALGVQGWLLAWLLAFADSEVAHGTCCPPPGGNRHGYPILQGAASHRLHEHPRGGGGGRRGDEGEEGERGRGRAGGGGRRGGDRWNGVDWAEEEEERGGGGGRGDRWRYTGAGEEEGGGGGGRNGRCRDLDREGERGDDFMWGYAEREEETERGEGGGGGGGGGGWRWTAAGDNGERGGGEGRGRDTAELGGGRGMGSNIRAARGGPGQWVGREGEEVKGGYANTYEMGDTTQWRHLDRPVIA